jgi:hypothetical protein
MNSAIQDHVGFGMLRAVLVLAIMLMLAMFGRLCHPALSTQDTYLTVAVVLHLGCDLQASGLCAALQEPRAAGRLQRHGASVPRTHSQYPGVHDPGMPGFLHCDWPCCDLAS